MKQINAIVIVVVSLITISGCSTTPVSYEMAKQVSASKIHDKSLIKVGDEKEQIKVIRDRGVFGSACTHTIFVNNQKAFDIEPGEAITLSLEPGNHFFRLESGVGICPDASISESTFLKLGEPQSFRVSISSTGQIMLSRVE
jgi:hypothetical protein